MNYAIRTALIYCLLSKRNYQKHFELFCAEHGMRNILGHNYRFALVEDINIAAYRKSSRTLKNGYHCVAARSVG